MDTLRKLEAEAKLGEMLDPKNRPKVGKKGHGSLGGTMPSLQKKLTPSIMLGVEEPSLSDIGITHKESSRAQELASMPENRDKHYVSSDKGTMKQKDLPEGITKKESHEAKLGKMLKETERAKGGAQYHEEPTSNTMLPVQPTLSDIGISKKEARAKR